MDMAEYIDTVDVLSSDAQALQGAAASQPPVGGSGGGASGSQGNVLPMDSSIEVLDFSRVFENIAREIKAVGDRLGNLEAFVESYRGNDLPSIKQSIEEVRKGLQAVLEDLVNVRREASIARLIGIVGLWKQPLCANNREGICMAWRLNSDGEFRSIYGDQSIAEVDGVKRVRVSIAYHLCGLCPLFRPRHG
ncbi:MAG: hypothetical protein QXE01_03875 [Sulfolobales archaeon]